MWPVAVVMLQEDVEGPLKMLVVQDRQPVETRCASGAHEPLRDTVRLRRAEPIARQPILRIRSGRLYAQPKTWS